MLWQAKLVVVTGQGQKLEGRFPASNGYVPFFSFSNGRGNGGDFPTKEEISTVVGDWDGKTLVLTPDQIGAYQRLDLAVLLPKQYKRSTIYMVETVKVKNKETGKEEDEEILQAMYFLGMYCCPPGTIMDGPRVTYLRDKDKACVPRPEPTSRFDYCVFGY